MSGVRSTVLLMVLLFGVLVAACGGHTADETTVPTTLPPGSTTTPTTATTTSTPSTTSAPVTTLPAEPNIEITPAAAPSGTRFMVHGTGCALPDRPGAPLVEAYIAVEWVDGLSIGGVEAHNVQVAEDGSWVEELASSDWWHWVVRADGYAFYTGLGANPGTYRVSAGCLTLGDGLDFTALFAYPEQFFAITDEPPVYLVDTLRLIPDVLAAPGDTEYRDLFMMPRGSGCVVEGTDLPDGVWFGYVRELRADAVEFDLACFFTDEAAHAAAAADGQSTLRAPMIVGPFFGDPPYVARPGVHVRNRNPLTFALPTNSATRVWRLTPVMPTAFGHTEGPLDPWLDGQSYLDCPGPECSVWLYVNGGRVAAIVEQYLPSSSAMAIATTVADWVAAEWPPSWSWGEGRQWECHPMSLGPVEAGSVLACRSIGEHGYDPPYPVLTVLVLDDVRTLAVARADVYQPGPHVEDLEARTGPGLSCADLLAEASPLNADIGDPVERYFGVVLYWFLEGRPTRLDADGNGRPCEAEFVASVDAGGAAAVATLIEDVWAGGWIGAAP